MGHIKFRPTHAQMLCWDAQWWAVLPSEDEAVDEDVEDQPGHPAEEDGLPYIELAIVEGGEGCEEAYEEAGEDDCDQWEPPLA